MKQHDYSKQMYEYAMTLKGGTDRAQAINISTKLKGTGALNSIAQMMIDDHNGISHSLRHSHLLVEAKLATYEKNARWPGCYGRFHFIDGSILSARGVEHE